MKAELRQALEETDVTLRAAFEKILPPQKVVTDSAEDKLWEAMRYILMGGGKRVRPFLVREFGRIFAVAEPDIWRVAMAVEAVHCYSLVHDDLPAMDDDDERRGRPSVHRAYDEATAILTGDALQSLGFRCLCDLQGDSKLSLRLVAMLADAIGAGGMVGGQMLDIGSQEGGGVVTADVLTRLQRLKTGYLFGFSCESMAVLGGASDDMSAGVRGYAHDLGLAFQMTDDLLDGEGEEGWVGLIGEEAARRQVGLLCEQAVEHLGVFDKKADLLRELARHIPDRKH